MIKLNTNFVLVCPEDLYDNTTYDSFLIKHEECYVNYYRNKKVAAITPTEDLDIYSNNCWNCQRPFPDQIIAKVKFIVGNYYATTS